MKNIVLVSPNVMGSYRSANINDENLAIGYLAAVLSMKGYNVEIIDARMEQLSPELSADRIKKKQPFFIGISMISEESVLWVQTLGEALKEMVYLKHVCAGGYYPSLQPEVVLQRLSFVDSVVNGEGEITIVDLVKKIELNNHWEHINGITTRASNGSATINPRRLPISNLDDLPWPKRYGNQGNTEILIEGSRGCFGRCNFCAVGPHFGLDSKLRWRGRSPENILSEILMLRKLFPGNRKYRFIDPDFFGSSSDMHSERILKLAHLIQREVSEIEIYIEGRVTDVHRRDVLLALKQAGLKEIYLGVESGSDRILKIMRKNISADKIIDATQLLDELDINYQYGHMMVTPWTNYEDIVHSLALLQRIGRIQFDKLFNELYVIPGTDLVDQVAKHCNLIKEEGTGYYSYEMSYLVDNIRTFGLIFETKYKSFSKNLWFLYKDVQKHEQCHIDGAVLIQRKLSSLFIKIFESCLERSRSSPLNNSEICDIIEEIIARFQDDLVSIRESLDPSITFINPFLS